MASPAVGRGGGLRAWLASKQAYNIAVLGVFGLGVSTVGQWAENCTGEARAYRRRWLCPAVGSRCRLESCCRREGCLPGGPPQAAPLTADPFSLPVQVLLMTLPAELISWKAPEKAELNLQTTFGDLSVQGWLSLLFIAGGFLLMVFDLVGGGWGRPGWTMPRTWVSPPASMQHGTCPCACKPCPQRCPAPRACPTALPNGHAVLPAHLLHAADLVMNMVLALCVSGRAALWGGGCACSVMCPFVSPHTGCVPKNTASTSAHSIAAGHFQDHHHQVCPHRVLLLRPDDRRG